MPPEVFIAGSESVLDVDVKGAALAVEVPTLFLASARPWLDLNRVHELRPDWFLGRTVGGGHFHQVLVPDQVNSQIGRFLECVAAGVTTAPESERSTRPRSAGVPGNRRRRGRGYAAAAFRAPCVGRPRWVTRSRVRTG